MQTSIISVCSCNKLVIFNHFVLQKKAEEAHKILEGLGPKVELVISVLKLFLLWRFRWHIELGFFFIQEINHPFCFFSPCIINHQTQRCTTTTSKRKYLPMFPFFFVCCLAMGTVQWCCHIVLHLISYVIDLSAFLKVRLWRRIKPLSVFTDVCLSRQTPAVCES